jgi:hypothetical protein
MAPPPAGVDAFVADHSNDLPRDFRSELWFIRQQFFNQNPFADRV